MRIGIISPPWYSIPPNGYGGSELVVYLLARELHAMGHDITVFGAESEDPALDFVSLVPGGWSSDLGTPEERFRIATYIFRAYRHVSRRRFDVVHDHTEASGPVLAADNGVGCPVVATIHSAVHEAQATLFGDIDRYIDLVAISEAQRSSAAHVRWAGVVHNAFDERQLGFSEQKRDYLVELGRITPDKGQHLAIEVARHVGVELVLAGKVDPAPEAQEYFHEYIAPHLGHGVTWLEEVAGAQKAVLLAEAKAMLFPLQWEEPFGIAMVEAMASGTPVIAFRRGAAPELIEPGITGYLTDDVEGMVAAFSAIDRIDPKACAARARERFSARKMAEGYEAIYLRASEAFASSGRRRAVLVQPA